MAGRTFLKLAGLVLLFQLVDGALDGSNRRRMVTLPRRQLRPWLTHSPSEKMLCLSLRINRLSESGRGAAPKAQGSSPTVREGLVLAHRTGAESRAPSLHAEGVRDGSQG